MKYIYSTIENAIRKLLISLSIETPEQLDMFEIARKLNVNLYFIDGICEANTLGAQNNIFINENLCLEKKRQSFAHELGHILLHDGYQLRLKDSFVDYQEWKANSFMYHFCVPTFMLEQIQFPRLFKQAAWLIAETFNVELHFAAIRLKQWIEKKQAIMFYRNIAIKAQKLERSKNYVL